MRCFARHCTMFLMLLYARNGITERVQYCSEPALFKPKHYRSFLLITDYHIDVGNIILDAATTPVLLPHIKDLLTRKMYC